MPYYVDKNFEKNYQGAELQELEKTVEKDYIDYIQTSCWKEKQQSKLFLLQVCAYKPSGVVWWLHKALLVLASLSNAYNISNLALVFLTSAFNTEFAILEGLSEFILGDSERQVESRLHHLRYFFPLSFYAWITLSDDVLNM